AMTLMALVASLPNVAGGQEDARAEPAAVDRAIHPAIDFLIARQSADGAWRSETYGAFRDGDALTPLALQALLAAPESASRRTACQRAARYLAEMIEADGARTSGDRDLNYPIYTAAGAVVALSHP